MVFGLIASLGCYLDLATKRWVFAWRGQPQLNNEWWLWQGYVGIETSLNTGALFGLGTGKTHYFAVASVVAFFAILYWLFIAKAAREMWLTVAMGCISAGIFGNLYDRLGLWTPPWAPAERIAAVRDWILFQYGPWKWPNFNIADALLVCGAGMLLLHAFWFTPPAEQPKPDAAPAH